jgi:hemolysin D
MPQLNETYKPDSNGHNQDLDTDFVTLQTESNSFTSQNRQDLETSDDWSFATKELLDALPQRWTRGLLYFLTVFIAIALPWGMLSKVDETGSARGRLEPQGGTLKQELNLTYTSANVYTQTAKVEKVYVKEGDKIEAGDILIELESRPIRDRLDRLQIQRQGQGDRLNTLEQQKNQLEIEWRTQERQNQSQQLEKLSQIEQARQTYQALKTTYNLQEQEKQAQVYQAEQNLAALRRTLNLQREEKLTQVHQAEQNLAALRRTLNLQREEKRSQVSQAKQQLEDSKTAYNLSEIRWEKALGEVDRYRLLLAEGAVTEVQVVEKEDIAEERQRIWEQSQADLEQAKLRIEEQESSYQRVIHQGEADIEQAKLRLAEQKSSYDRMINQGEADIEQAELRLAEQQSSYDRIIHQSKAEIEQAELRLSEQENNAQTLTHSGDIALSKVQDQLKNLESQMSSIKAELAQTEKEIDSLNFELDKRVVRAEAGGTIFHLATEGVGDVVQQGEMIVEIAPQQTNLFLKAQMATTESGSLQEGMAVKLKFDAYPFQDYGVVGGTLKKISPTSQVEKTAQGNVDIYELEVELNQDCIATGNECIVLRPGDTATAEVVVRQRRIIDFILDPFKKLQKGGLDL